jgi:heliorhodopsin
MTAVAESARPTASPPAATDARFRGLRRYNLVAAAVHAAQAIAVLLLANGFALPVIATYMQGPPGTPPGPPTTLFEIRVAWGVAAFLGLSALAHLVVASPTFFPRYVAGLRRHRNIFRWVEYSLSSSLMIVLIAQIVGISDATALLAIFGVNAAMILFGWLQERYEEPGSRRWLPFVFGCIAGAVPWLAITLYLVAPGSPSPAEPPGFVYGIFVSLFILFNIFALNQWLQYRRLGRWADYLVGERAYITLSLVAKSLLAWQVFAGTLAG